MLVEDGSRKWPRAARRTGYFRVRKSRAWTLAMQSFKFSLADTLFCFILLKLCFTGETL
jgi:hypothetical protein